MPALSLAIAPTSRSISCQSAMRLAYGGARGGPGGVFTAGGREAPRAGPHRLGDRRFHPAQIVLAGVFVEAAAAHRVHAQRRMADIHAVIETLRQALHI